MSKIIRPLHFKQLGNNETISDSSIPLAVPDINNAVKVSSAYWSRSCALLNNNTVKCWGGNDKESNNRYLIPTVLNTSTTTNIVDVIAEDEGETIIIDCNGSIKRRGTVYNGWIPNYSGNQPNGYTFTETFLDVPNIKNSINYAGECVLLNNGSVKCWGEVPSNFIPNYTGNNRSEVTLTPVTVPGISNAVSIFSGQSINSVCVLLKVITQLNVGETTPYAMAVILVHLKYGLNFNKQNHNFHLVI